MTKLRGRVVEHAAIDWVMAYERAHQRQPVDRRGERAYPGDIESTGRVIEIKSTYSDFRGWYLALQPVQRDAAMDDSSFHVYVVEKIGQGDPALFRLRILAGDQLRQMVTKAVERHYYEVPWPTALYDATPVETMPAGTGVMGEDGPAAEP